MHNFKFLGNEHIMRENVHLMEKINSLFLNQSHKTIGAE